jgi:DNA-directed RNA polymerase specialized sigma24 family protein
LKLSNQEMTQTETLIRDLKSRVNPATGAGYEYSEIGALLGITKQAAQQHVHDKKHQCPKCLRRLRRAPKFHEP